jgi:hypothetical protein
VKRSSFGSRKPDSKTAAKKPAAKKPVDHRAAAQKATIRALAKAKRLADRAGVKLSEWEDEFLGSVTERVKTYGRAFADPEKGDPRAPLSMMQAVKLKEIAAKAKGEKPGSKGEKQRPRRGFKKKSTPSPR